MSKQLQGLQTLSNEEFAKMAHAIANSSSIIIQGTTFYGKDPCSLDDMTRYYAKIQSPNTTSEALLVATRVSANKEYYPHLADEHAPIKNRIQLRQIYNNIAVDIRRCLDEGRTSITFSHDESNEGIYTYMSCSAPAPVPMPRPVPRSIQI